MKEPIYQWDFKNAKNESAKWVLKIVCEVFDIGEVELTGNSRKRKIVDARGTYCYLLYKHKGLTLEHIGSILNREHQTVMHLIERTEALVHVRDRDLYPKVKRIEEQFFNQTIS